MVSHVLVFAAESEPLVPWHDMEVRVQPHGLDAHRVEVVKGPPEEGLANVLPAEIGVHDHRAEERDLSVGRRARDPDAFSPVGGDETALGRQRKETRKVRGRVAPPFEIREADRPGYVPPREGSDLCSRHRATRACSSSTSSHSWYPYVTNRLSFRAFLYMHGPYSSSSWPYHLSQSLHWSRVGSCAWRSFGSSYIPRDMVRLTERLAFKPAESAWTPGAWRCLVGARTRERVSRNHRWPSPGTGRS